MWKKAATSKKISEDKTETELITNESKTIESKAKLEPVSKMKPKKKRKKDKNAGLLYSLNKDDNSVKAVTNIKQKLQNLNIEKASVSTISNQNTKNHQNPNKNKNKSNLLKNTAKKGAIPQPSAKRNNLLHLANALKAKGSPSGANSQVDKLKQLLR